MRDLEWVVYCMSCKEELARAPNGIMMNALGELHVRDTNHKVLVGYEAKEEE